ncbi:GNAT family N-acetyltransferase [Pseudonocardia sp. GCM10023141]|uniref:GNAT family N-acetyltransferase n=1 Tax=Pseudonocardia sp. GCM10023141 TaxID=3252653 RepID=UPI003606B2C1
MELERLIGQRVSLRQLVGERDGRPLYSDAVGDLTRVDDALTVLTRRGPVAVDEPAVVAVRAVPPPVPRRASLAAVTALESLCADAWPAQVDEPLGAWRLRAAGGYTGRANSALAIGSPGLPLPAALDAVHAFARRTGIGPRVQVPVGSPWDRAVAAAGWVLDAGHKKGAEVSVQVAELATIAAAQAAVELPERPDPDWWTLAVGGDPSAAERHVLDPNGSPLTTFAQVRGSDGRITGQARGTVVADHLHLSMLEVEPAARRTGIATMLLRAVAAWGREHGARWGVLQVALHNVGAVALYERLGFVEHHQYRYLIPPPATGAVRPA